MKPDDYITLIYSAIVKQAHGGAEANSDLYRRMMSPIPFVRGQGCWLERETLRPLGRQIRVETAKEFSSARAADAEDPERSVSLPMLVEQHLQDGDIPGYAPIVPVLGATLYFIHNKTSESVGGSVRAIPSKRSDSVRYLTQALRMAAEEQATTITGVYQGYNLDYTKLVMVAKGCAERGFGDSPMIRVRGVSGSQKTGNVMVTAAALGEIVSGLTAQKTDNYGEAIGSAAQGSTLILGDEILKGIPTWATSDLRPLLLSLNRKYTYRKLYAGTTTMDFNSALILSDTDTPPDLHEDEQYCRRFIDVCLTTRVPDWMKTGVDWSAYWCHTPEMRLAFDSLYSDLIDTYFYEGSTMSFQDMARDLGFDTVENTLLKTEDGQQVRDAVIGFFWEVIRKGGTILPKTAKQGNGWKEVTFAVEGKTDAIGKALEAVQLATCRSGIAALEFLKKFDGRWIELAGAKFGARFEHRTTGGKIYVRFVHGETKSQSVNDELMTEEAYKNHFTEEIIP